MNRPQDTTLTTHHVIKVVALVIMTIDHIGAFLYPEDPWLRAVGRITFPVWFFLVGHARHYTTSRSLLLWGAALAIISPFLGVPAFPLNALIGIAACQWVLRQVEQRGMLANEPWMLMVACLLFALPSQYVTEYGTVGLLYALMGYAVRSGQMQWNRGGAIAVLALLSFLGTQRIVFGFDTLQMGFVIVATATVTLYLARFTHRPVAVPGWARALVRPTLAVSRHSMHYYVIHRIVLQGAGIALARISPAFRWF